MKAYVEEYSKQHPQVRASQEYPSRSKRPGVGSTEDKGERVGVVIEVM